MMILLKSRQGSILVVVVVVLMLLTVIASYVGYETMSSLRDATVQKDEVGLKAQLYTHFQQVVHPIKEKLTQDRHYKVKKVIDRNDGCWDFVLNRQNIDQIYSKYGSDGVLLRFSDQCNDQERYDRYQLWIKRQDLYIHGDITLLKNYDPYQLEWRNSFGTAYDLRLKRDTEEFPCLQNCNQLQLTLERKSSFIDYLHFDDDSGDERSIKNYFLAMTSTQQNQILLLDRLGAIWLVNIFSANMVDAKIIGQYDFGALHNESLVNFHSVVDGKEWRIAWGFTNNIFVSTINRETLHFDDRFPAINFGVIQEDSDGFSMRKKGVGVASNSWQLALPFQILKAINGTDYIAIEAVTNSERWLWLFDWLGQPLYGSDFAVSFSKEGGNHLRRIAPSCSAALEEIVEFGRWQIGCRLPSISHIELVY